MYYVPCKRTLLNAVLLISLNRPYELILNVASFLYYGIYIEAVVISISQLLDYFRDVLI